MRLKRKIHFLMVSLLFFFIFFYSIYGKEIVLEQTDNETSVDGIINPEEYSFSFKYKQLTLYLNRTIDRLYVGVIAETKGWIAVGFNTTPVMNNAEILIGFVKDGKITVRKQKVTGRKHEDFDLPYIVSNAMIEDSKKTTLEAEIIPAHIIKPGQKVLNVILAFGADDDITKYHKLRTGVTINLKDY